jgi:hypothetical protein
VGRRSLGVWIGFGVLAVVLAALAVLLPLAFRGEGMPTTTFAVGQFENTPCSLLQEEARCYTAVVTNTGEHAAVLQCHLTDLGGPPAQFLSGETTYSSPNMIDAKSSVPLTIRLVPSSGSSPALPRLTCEAA